MHPVFETTEFKAWWDEHDQLVGRVNQALGANVENAEIYGKCQIGLFTSPGHRQSMGPIGGAYEVYLAAKIIGDAALVEDARKSLEQALIFNSATQGVAIGPNMAAEQVRQWGSEADQLIAGKRGGGRVAAGS